MNNRYSPYLNYIWRIIYIYIYSKHNEHKIDRQRGLPSSIFHQTRERSEDNTKQHRGGNNDRSGGRGAPRSAPNRDE